MRKNFIYVLTTLALLLGSVAAPAAAQTLTCEQDYVVQADDSLSKIADKIYGDPQAFPVIFEATNAATGNYSPIANPNLIQVGWTLCLPGSVDAQAMLNDSMMSDDMKSDGLTDGGLIDGSPMILATSNPGDLSGDMIAGLSLDLMSHEPVYSGFSNIASVQSVALSQAGTAYVTYDATTEATGGIMVLDQLLGDAMTDGSPVQITGSNTGLMAPKGLDIAETLGLVLVADFGAKDIKGFSLDANGNVAPEFVAQLGGERSVWDVAYDATNDILYASGTDGAALAYDNFMSAMAADAPSRIITPVDNDGNKVSVNLHGIAYLPAADLLVLSDVGDAASASDGQLFTIANPMGAVNTAPYRLGIGGSMTMLGNPVDLVVDGATVYIAEKSNDAVLRYDNITTRTGYENAAADLVTPVTKAESVFIVK